MSAKLRVDVYDLVQWSPTFLAPGIGSVEDSFSTDWGCEYGFGMIPVQ